MILKVFAIYDSKAEAYLPPFFCSSKGVAIRMFSDAASDGTHNFCKHSSDYTLFELGSFDDNSALFLMHPAPVPLGTALEHAVIK